jgi:hypothetical protein
MILSISIIHVFTYKSNLKQDRNRPQRTDVETSRVKVIFIHSFNHSLPRFLKMASVMPPKEDEFPDTALIQKTQQKMLSCVPRTVATLFDLFKLLASDPCANYFHDVEDYIAAYVFRHIDVNLDIYSQVHDDESTRYMLIERNRNPLLLSRFVNLNGKKVEMMDDTLFYYVAKMAWYCCKQTSGPLMLDDWYNAVQYMTGVRPPAWLRHYFSDLVDTPMAADRHFSAKFLLRLHFLATHPTWTMSVTPRSVFLHIVDLLVIDCPRKEIIAELEEKFPPGVIGLVDPLI